MGEWFVSTPNDPHKWPDKSAFSEPLSLDRACEIFERCMQRMNMTRWGVMDRVFSRAYIFPKRYWAYLKKRGKKGTHHG